MGIVQRNQLAESRISGGGGSTEWGAAVEKDARRGGTLCLVAGKCQASPVKTRCDVLHWRLMMKGSLTDRAPGKPVITRKMTVLVNIVSQGGIFGNQIGKDFMTPRKESM